MIERCKECGANLAMVGIRHRCIPQPMERTDAASRNLSRNPKERSTSKSVGSPTKNLTGKRARQRVHDDVAAKSIKTDLGLAATKSIAPPQARKNVSRSKKPTAQSAAGSVKRGRPPLSQKNEPWVAAGMTRRTWYRRQAEKAK